jgi:hypothetical protein
MLKHNNIAGPKKQRKKEKKVREKKRERERERENKVIVAAICLQCNSYLENEKCPSIVIILSLFLKNLSQFLTCN